MNGMPHAAGDALRFRTGTLRLEWRLHRALWLGALPAAAAMWVLFALDSRPESHDLNFAFAFLGVVFALLAGIAPWRGAGRDHAEEFVLALPPRRADLFAVRLGWGLALVLAVQAFGALALASEWPWALRALLPLSAFPADPAGCAPAGGPAYAAFAFAAPLAAYASAFAAGARSGRTAWILEPGACLFVLVFLYLVFFNRAPGAGSWPVVAGLVAFAPGRLALGYRAFLGREAALGAEPGSPASAAAVALSILLLLILSGLAVLGALAFTVGIGTA